MTATRCHIWEASFRYEFTGPEMQLDGLGFIWGYRPVISLESMAICVSDFSELERVMRNLCWEDKMYQHAIGLVLRSLCPSQRWRKIGTHWYTPVQAKSVLRPWSWGLVNIHCKSGSGISSSPWPKNLVHKITCQMNQANRPIFTCCGNALTFIKMIWHWIHDRVFISILQIYWRLVISKVCAMIANKLPGQMVEECPIFGGILNHMGLFFWSGFVIFHP